MSMKSILQIQLC